LKLAVGIPAYGGRISSGHMLQAGQLAWGWSQAQFQAPLFMTVDSAGVDKARNVLVEKALATPTVDWLLQCDADTYYPIAPNIYKMLDEADKRGAAVIGAAVKMRKRPGYNVAKADYTLVSEEEWRGRVMEVERIGTAFTAVDLRWLRKVWPTAPWFRFDYAPSRDGLTMECTGEDYYFCRGVRDRGGTILVDGRFEPVHVGASDETGMLMSLGGEAWNADHGDRL
jgi:hypothetical protein